MVLSFGLSVALLIINAHARRTRQPYRTQKPSTWSKILAYALDGLGLAQLVNGLGLTVCSLLMFWTTLRDPHAMLALSQCLLGTFTQAPIMTLLFEAKKMRRRPFLVRAVLNLCQTAVILVAWFIGKRPRTGAMRATGIILSVLIVHTFICTLALGSVVFVPRNGSRTTWLKHNSIIVSSISFVSSLGILALMVYLKFFNEVCDLDTGADNMWTFGQILPLVVLLAVPIAVFEGWTGKSWRDLLLSQVLTPLVERKEEETLPETVQSGQYVMISGSQHELMPRARTT